MQEFSVATTALPEILAVVARGESVRLVDDGRAIAVLSPIPQEPLPKLGEGLFAALREKYQLDKHGFTEEEIEAMRDRSPGPPPITFD